jgi:exosortase/archaeosortase family protein
MKSKKMLLWIAISIAIILAGSKAFFMQSSTHVANDFTAHPLVILMMCSIFGWLKRDVILQQIDDGNLFAESAYLVAGAVIIILSIMMPESTNLAFVLFKILLTLVGVFFVFFGAAAYLPSLLVFVYGFSVSFPKLLDEFFGTQYALVTTRLTAGAAGLVYPVGYDGQLISLINSEGVKNVVYIDSGCSGSASIAIFLTIFALMMIDIKPPSKYILPLFIFGIVGTSLQNILRLVVLLSTNYHFGSNAMWQMHAYAGYFLFPIWLAIFIYVYLKIGVMEYRVVPNEQLIIQNRG